MRSSQTIIVDLEELSSELNDDELTNADDEVHSQEHSICEDAIEDVDFIIDLPGSNHVEDLHQHKNVEENGQMSGGSNVLEGSIHKISSKVLLRSVEHEGEVITIHVVWVWMILDILHCNHSCFLILWDKEVTGEKHEEENQRLED